MQLAYCGTPGPVARSLVYKDAKVQAPSNKHHVHPQRAINGTAQLCTVLPIASTSRPVVIALPSHQEYGRRFVWGANPVAGGVAWSQAQ